MHLTYTLNELVQGGLKEGVRAYAFFFYVQKTYDVVQWLVAEVVVAGSERKNIDRKGCTKVSGGGRDWWTSIS